MENIPSEGPGLGTRQPPGSLPNSPTRASMDDGGIWGAESGAAAAAVAKMNNRDSGRMFRIFLRFGLSQLLDSRWDNIGSWYL